LAGVYIHIPFCRQACHYCNFHFATSLRLKDKLVQAILSEIELQKNYFTGETAETIYFGGGTPSLLSVDETRHIIQELKKIFSVTNDAEITLEANPDDITVEKLTGWKQAGINRLSIGIQSFFDEDLKWLNRAHTAQQATDNLKLAKRYFTHTTIDLIYGLPGLTDEKWKQNVDMAIELNIPHLSCYALTVEQKTPLDKMIRGQKKENVDPGKQSKQFLLLMQWMEEAGYEHYEISNFAKSGFRSQHNSSYWQGKKYLGIGPSAHSFNGNERSWNVSNNNLYISAVQEGKLPAEKETLTSLQKLNEYIMVSLRTIEGINLRLLDSVFGIEQKAMLDKAGNYISSGLLKPEKQSLILTREGKLLADGIAASLFF